MNAIATSTAAFLLIASLSASVPVAETLKQDFTSMADLNAFWSISTWGGDNRTHAAANVTIADGILSLKLSGSQSGQKPVCAEISSKRDDFRYGSYRASIKTSRTPGGVVGWFIYRGSPLNEIDVEMLTKDNSDLHFTLHHIETNVDYKLVKLGFDPSAAFHEYRFDWYADKVAYFVDGKPTATLAKNVPDTEAPIMLNHWSGNIEGWGGPAPAQDMFMYVDWMEFSTEYPAPVTLQSAQEVRVKAHRGALLFDGGGIRALYGYGGNATDAVGASATARLYTIQGRMTVTDREPSPNTFR